MAVTSSAPISITDLVTEFGGSAPHSLTEYYRGGSLVPNVTANNSVPTSGAISLTDFFGATATSGTDDRTITIGSGSFGSFILGYGFAAAPLNAGSGFGLISSNTIGFSGFNVTIEAVYHILNQLVFKASTNPGNSGWTSMTVGSTTFNRTDAITYVSGTIATWSWSSSSNVIGTSGTQTVSWQE